MMIFVFNSSFLSDIVIGKLGDERLEEVGWRLVFFFYLYLGMIEVEFK